ncbi:MULTISPECIES: hypothetical protein [unclassified Streptomyces]|uniref:hypothetical protein n=1 Tax=unclassified Streptomyces TaxID=2593676 RepID=UPI0004CAA124|nr:MULTISPECIES: hypothetical protein [unclassified Streptomyces]KOV86107.1 hypothetical protein ADL02_19670 [Streptomyces sp. NRRL WC-3723]
MSTEIAHRDEPAAVATQPQNLPQPEPTAGTTALVAWAQEASLAYDMATKLAATSFVPASLRGKPGDIAAAILAGSELGLKPMATLKSIDVIQGSPALRAHAMRGLVQAHGHKIQLVESTDTYCKMRGLRKDEDTWQEVEWDIPRAQRLGLLGKDQWKKQPRTMLVARATGEICRLIASDVLHGMPYVAEELGDFVHGELVPQKAPLSVAAITAPASAPQQPVAETDAIDVQADADEAADALWDDAPPAGSGNWPEVAQPGGDA